MIIVDGPVENVVKPAPCYAEIAGGAREMGIDVANDDYEQVDNLLESKSALANFTRVCR